MWSRIIKRFGGGDAPSFQDLSPGKMLGSSQGAEDDCSIRSGRCIDPKSIITPAPPKAIGYFPQFSPHYVNNYRRIRNIKLQASGLRFPFTPRALSGWYVPSPDLVNRPWVYLNGRNAEYSGLLASTLVDLSQSRTGRKRVLLSL